MTQEPQAAVQPQLQKHSGFGIASFVVGILCFLGFGIIFLAAGVYGVQNPDYKADDDPVILIVGLLMLATMGIALIGAVLGIVSFFTSKGPKVFGVIGVCINGLIVLSAILMMIVGTISD